MANPVPKNTDYQVFVDPNDGQRIRYRTHAREGSLKERYVGNNCSVSIQYDVSWLNRWKFALALLGNSQIATHASGKKYIHRVLPHGYFGTIIPVVPGDRDLPKSWLWASQLENMEGKAPIGYDANGAPLYKEARLTVTYETVSFRMATDREMINDGQVMPGTGGMPDEAERLGRYVTRFIQPTAEYFALPHGRFHWATSTTTAGNAYLGSPVTGSQLGFIIPFQELVYIWHQVPRIRKASDGRPPAYAVPKAIRKLLGAVNSVTFDGFDPGTLLLTAVEVKPYRWIGGFYYADITYKMKYMNAVKPIDGTHYNPPRGHNYFLQMPKPPTGDVNTGIGFVDYNYELISHNANPLTTGPNPGIRVYREFDFKELFRPDQE